ncbi:MAG: DUF4924 family protein [Alistipes sp.]
MDIAQTKRRENIAEYILYLWQLEDLLRALQFSPEAIYSQLVAPRNISEEGKHNFLIWYMELTDLLRKEGKEQQGHLDHTLHLIGDLHHLHLQLLELPVGQHYRTLYARLAPELPHLRAILDKETTEISDTEICFRALYAAMLYRIKGTGSQSAIQDTLEFISPVIAELAAIYHKVERGEVDLFKTE